MPTCSHPSLPLISGCPYKHFLFRFPRVANRSNRFPESWFPAGFHHICVCFCLFIFSRILSPWFLKAVFLNSFTRDGRERREWLQRNKLADVFCFKTLYVAIFTRHWREMQHNIVLVIVSFIFRLLILFILTCTHTDTYAF